MFAKKHIKTSLRFRQWSRKSYATFYSVGRHVTIGQLKCVVADKLLGKQKNLIPEFSFFDESVAAREADDSPDAFVENELLYTNLIIAHTCSRTIVCGKKPELNNWNKYSLWPKVFQYAFGHFFIGCRAMSLFSNDIKR
ncbi:MAG: hypothetical protein QM727_05330 [Niabella sp.]